MVGMVDVIVGVVVVVVDVVGLLLIGWVNGCIRGYSR